MPLTLVTGAPGWLGTRLVKTLLDETPPQDGERRVRCLVMPGLDVSALGVSERLEIFRGDLRNPEEVKAFCRGAGGATLFHSAGVIHPARFVRELMEVNVQGTRHLLQAAQEAGVRRAVVISSTSSVGSNLRRDDRFDEKSPYRPYMKYGRSKVLMEQLVHQYQSNGKLEAVILRPTWFYGPDQPLRQTTFFSMIKNGTMPIMGDGEQRRSLTYIDNLCQAMLLSEHNPLANGQTYLIADRRPYSMNEIVDTVERLMETEFGLKVSHRRLRLPSLVSKLAQLNDAVIQNLGLYHQKIHVLSQMNKTIACSVEKAQRELGYNPAVELEEGMRRSLAWCMAKGIAL